MNQVDIEKAVRDTMGSLLWQLTVANATIQALTAERDALQLQIDTTTKA